MRKVILIIFILFFHPCLMSAQRAVVGQGNISVGCSAWEAIGVDLYWSHVSYGFPFRIGVHYRHAGPEWFWYDIDSDEMSGISSGDLSGTLRTKSHDVYASFGVTKNVYAVRSKAFRIGLYADFNTGARIHALVDSDGYVPRAKFIYGVDIGAEMEAFLYKGLSFYAYYSPRLQAYGHSDQERMFFQDFGLGLRVYFFMH